MCGFIVVCTDLPATGQNSLTHWKARIWLSWLSKKIPDSPTQTDRAQFGKVTYPLQNYACFSPLTSGLESFGHKSTPSDRPWIEAYCLKF